MFRNPITDKDGLDINAISYQWKRNDINITGATDISYILVQADVSKNITVIGVGRLGLGLALLIEKLATDKSSLFDSINSFIALDFISSLMDTADTLSIADFN